MKTSNKNGQSASPITAKTAGIKLASFASITLAFASITDTAFAAGPVFINTVNGYSDGAGIIVGGRWTGQPNSAPKTASNVYNTFGAIESQSNTLYWDIYGSNFGTTIGSVWVMDGGLRPLTNVEVKILSWSDTKIRIVPRGNNASFRFDKGAYLAVSLDKAIPNQCNQRIDIVSFPVVGIIKSRGFGQCTWYVANKRLSAGLPIPPTAYTTTTSIAAVGSYDNGYIPQQWDCLTYGSRHVAIITSAPVRTVKADGSLLWSFTVGEMNASWNEAESTSQRSYWLSAADGAGRRVVRGAIGSNAGMTATGVFR